MPDFDAIRKSLQGSLQKAGQSKVGGTGSEEEAPGASPKPPEDEISDIKARLAKLETPLYKRFGVLAAAFAVVMFVFAYIIVPYWTADASLPRHLHRTILHTDRALASSLSVSAAPTNGASPSPLFGGLKDLINRHLDESDDGTWSVITNLVRDAQLSAYHGSAQFLVEEITTDSLSCFASRDENFRTLFVKVLGDLDMGQMCADTSENMTINYYRPTSYALPFAAEKGDTVTINVLLSSTDNTVPDSPEATFLDPRQYVEVNRYDNTPIELSGAGNSNVATAEYQISDGNRVRQLTFNLNDSGFNRIQQGSPIGLTAIVVVEPQKD